MGRCQQEILEGRRLPDPPGIPAQLLLEPPWPENPEPDLAASQSSGLTNRRMRTRMSGGVRGGGATPPPTRFRYGSTWRQGAIQAFLCRELATSVMPQRLVSTFRLCCL